MNITRRFFLQATGAVLATCSPVSLISRSAMGASPETQSASSATTQPLATALSKTLVVIFLRGGADGMNLVVPHFEPDYYKLRPGIAIARPKSGEANAAIDLDGRFALHPKLKALKPWFDQGSMAAIHAVGYDRNTRSHFDAQDFMESGTPGVKNTDDGWLNRALQAEDLVHRCAGTCEAHTAFRALALGADVPRTLAGKIPAIAMSNVTSPFRIEAVSCETQHEL